MNVLPVYTNRIRTLLQERKLSEKDFAIQIGIAPTSLSRVLNGRSPLSKKNLKRVCDFFGVHEDYILGKSDEIISLYEHNFREQNRLITHTLGYLNYLPYVGISVDEHFIVKDPFASIVIRHTLNPKIIQLNNTQIIDQDALDTLLMNCHGNFEHYYELYKGEEYIGDFTAADFEYVSESFAKMADLLTRAHFARGSHKKSICDSVWYPSKDEE